MKDIPVIFSAPMIRALLAGRKTMTRRLAWKDNPHGMAQPVKVGNTLAWSARKPTPWQRVKPGDRLWVRESLDRRGEEGVGYPADGDCHPDANWVWKNSALPSIHMPRGLSRLTLIVTATKIERLDVISEADAIAEGIERIGAEYIAKGSKEWDKGPNFYTVDVGDGSLNQPTAAATFALLWDCLHGEGSFNACQQVVALTFTVHNTNIDQLKEAA